MWPPLTVFVPPPRSVAIAAELWPAVEMTASVTFIVLPPLAITPCPSVAGGGDRRAVEDDVRAPTAVGEDAVRSGAARAVTGPPRQSRARRRTRTRIAGVEAVEARRVTLDFVEPVVVTVGSLSVSVPDVTSTPDSSEPAALYVRAAKVALPPFKVYAPLSAYVEDEEPAPAPGAPPGLPAWRTLSAACRAARPQDASPPPRRCRPPPGCAQALPPGFRVALAEVPQAPTRRRSRARARRAAAWRWAWFETSSFVDLPRSIGRLRQSAVGSVYDVDKRRTGWAGCGPGGCGSAGGCPTSARDRPGCAPRSTADRSASACRRPRRSSPRRTARARGRARLWRSR